MSHQTLRFKEIGQRPDKTGPAAPGTAEEEGAPCVLLSGANSSAHGVTLASAIPQKSSATYQTGFGGHSTRLHSGVSAAFVLNSAVESRPERLNKADLKAAARVLAEGNMQLGNVTHNSKFAHFHGGRPPGCRPHRGSVRAAVIACTPASWEASGRSCFQRQTPVSQRMAEVSFFVTEQRFFNLFRLTAH